MRPAPNHRATRTRRLTAGWLAAACLFLVAQMAVALHVHGAGDSPTREWVGQCELCVAQATPTAPPPASIPIPAMAIAESLDAGVEHPEPATRAPRSPHSPRAPPAVRPA